MHARNAGIAASSSTSIYALGGVLFLLLLHVSSTFSSNGSSSSSSSQSSASTIATALPAIDETNAHGSSSKVSVYWSQDLDSELSSAPLFSHEDGKNFAAKVRSKKVVKLESGCGRPKNLLATLSDGTRVCCRHREKQLKELRGDLYSYHLNGLIGLWNIPPTIIIRVDFSSDQWEQVAEQAKNGGWKDGSIIAMSMFINGLSDVYIPPSLRSIMHHKDKTLSTENVSTIHLSQSQQFSLMQWSDMALFDYIIGHTDRLFNTLYNYQWNKNMLEKKVHNLQKTASNHLVLIDNESAFWMGYAMGKHDSMKYNLQVQLLTKFCIFRESTVRKIISTWVHNDRDLASELEAMIMRTDYESFKLLNPLDQLQRKELNTRVSVSLELIKECAK